MLAFRPQGIPQPPRERLGDKASGERSAAPQRTSSSMATAPTQTMSVAENHSLRSAPSINGQSISGQTINAQSLHDAHSNGETQFVKKPEAVAAAPAAGTPRLQSVMSVERVKVDVAATTIHSAPKPLLSVVPSAQLITPSVPSAAELALNDFDNALWTARFAEFGIGGVVGTIASHCCLVERNGEQLHFMLDEKHASFFDPAHTQRITDQLCRVFNSVVRVNIAVGTPQLETPAVCRERLRAERLAHARQLIENDPNVCLLQQEFGAILDANSIQPRDD
jgi:DNA polymerase-3 subunit gamma/tau